ncbi:hypothetical protein OPQ81_001344 [Rhizoctonia solani]|nr:hypothetical protein OPQ81_001344 [Rhizoctonia solani]
MEIVNINFFCGELHGMYRDKGIALITFEFNSCGKSPSVTSCTSRSSINNDNMLYIFFTHWVRRSPRLA